METNTVHASGHGQLKTDHNQLSLLLTHFVGEYLLVYVDSAINLISLHFVLCTAPQFLMLLFVVSRLNLSLP